MALLISLLYILVANFAPSFSRLAVTLSVILIPPTLSFSYLSKKPQAEELACVGLASVSVQAGQTLSCRRCQPATAAFRRPLYTRRHLGTCRIKSGKARRALEPQAPPRQGRGRPQGPQAHASPGQRALCLGGCVTGGFRSCIAAQMARPVLSTPVALLRFCGSLVRTTVQRERQKAGRQWL